MSRKDKNKQRGEPHINDSHPIILRLDLRVKSFKQVTGENFIKIEGWNGFQNTILDVKDIQRLWVLQNLPRPDFIETEGTNCLTKP
jgi:hypothetical protein